MKGKCKWFNDAKGFGFLASEDGTDVFVHFTSIKMNGHKSLAEGDAVEFQIEASDRGPKAVNVIKV